jgi:hypothetical protein
MKSVIHFFVKSKKRNGPWAVDPLSQRWLPLRLSSVAATGFFIDLVLRR